MSLRVLCLDIEGGYGGSSRSLYECIRHLPKDVRVEVWCRREGPIQQRYAALGVPCRVEPGMPHISSLPRLSRNIYAYGRFLARWPSSLPFRRRLAAAAEGCDVVHFNHEGLFLLMRWFKRALGQSRPVLTMHIRTHLPSTMFSRWQYRTIASAADRLVFITENERTRMELLTGQTLRGQTIYNIVTPPSAAAPVHPKLAGERRFKVGALGNYAYIRGFDRLIDVAMEIQRRDRPEILFVVAGNMKLSRSLPGHLGKIGQRGGELAEYAAARGVADMFLFLGHVSEPETVLAGCDLVARPTRQADPWGRDVLEAMAARRPVLSVGSYDRFVETGVTGILDAEFDPAQWADWILALAADRAQLRRLGETARERVVQLCNGPDRAADLVRLWEQAKQPCAA